MEKRNYVVSETDLQNALKVKGAFGRFLARRIYRFLEIDKINAIQAEYIDYEGPDFSDKVLSAIGVTYEIPSEQLERIPAEGGFITVSNHHFGSIDGLILSSVIGRKRSDYKILTTFLLALIPGLQKTFMPVDNLTKGGSSRSFKGIKMALQHIHDGGALGFFPAGEVATYQKKEKRTAVCDTKVIEDKPWAENIIKLIKNSGFPVIPIYFQGTNSRFFHFLGKIHPRLRTVRLIHEMLNKRGTNVKVRIGAPITPEEISKYNISELGAYLRNRTYALEAGCLDDSPAQQNAVPIYEPVAEPIDPALVREEMEAISDRILFETGDFRCYLTTVDGIPNTMHELARLREETFRAVGEGTGKTVDTDEFDPFYHHLILWSLTNREIIGAYRIGPGSELIKKSGTPGFYTSTLFNFTEGNEIILSRCLELGRTFVAQKYQKEVLALKLLLSGLAASTLRFPDARYFIGPVSISNSIPDFYKSLIVYYLTRNCNDSEVSRLASPGHPFKLDFLAVNPEALLRGISSLDELDKLILTISDGKYRIPILVKKYFSYNAKLVCFNVDPLFCNSLDGLILLKLSDFPKNYLNALVKVLPEKQQEDVLREFPTE